MGQARELMDRATENFVRGDLEALREVLAPDVVATTPDAGTLRGVDAYLDYNRPFVEAFPDLAFEPGRRIETEDMAIDQGEMLGTHTQPLRLPDGQTIPPTGRQIRVREMDAITVRDGRIVRHDIYFDQLELLTQLGLMEAPAPTQT